MLSGKLATLLSGRYIEIEMLPLSFAEFYELVGGDKRDAWKRYFSNGSLPYTAYINDDEILHDYLLGIYNTVLLKDVVERKKIQDIALLQSVVKFIFDNIGNIVSSKKISDSLVSYGRKTTSVTIENYIQSLLEAYVIYKVERYDVKGKQHLKSLEKYYIVDTGLRKLLLGKNLGVRKTFWTRSKDCTIKAPLSKGAANKLPKAIYWRGIQAVGVYEFARHFGEFVLGTANPSTANAVPLPLTREALLRSLQVQQF